MSNATVTVRSSGGDYTSLNAALAGESANLTTNCHGTGSAGILTISCGNFEDTTAASTGTGYTTSSSYYINIVGDPSDIVSGTNTGVWSTSRYRLVYTGATASAIAVYEQHVRFSDIQIFLNRVGVSYEACINFAYYSGTNAEHYVVRSIFRSTGGSCDTAKFVNACDNGGLTVINSIFYDSRSVNGCKCIDAKANTIVYNCTFQNSYLGILLTGTSAVIQNCLFSSLNTGVSGTCAAGTDYNATNNAAIGYTVTGGGNTHDRLSQTFTFVDESGDNFHLAANDSGARDYGVDLSGTFTDDIDGQTRTGTWDIGADEYIAVSTGQPTNKRMGGIPFASQNSQSSYRW